MRCTIKGAPGGSMRSCTASPASSAACRILPCRIFALLDRYAPMYNVPSLLPNAASSLLLAPKSYPAMILHVARIETQSKPPLFSPHEKLNKKRKKEGWGYDRSRTNQRGPRTGQPTHTKLDPPFPWHESPWAKKANICTNPMAYSIGHPHIVYYNTS